MRTRPGAKAIDIRLNTGEGIGRCGPNQYAVAVTGRTGNDTLTAIHSALGAVSYLQGAMILDGGFGALDQCAVAGSSADRLHLLNCEQ